MTKKILYLTSALLCSFFLLYPVPASQAQDMEVVSSEVQGFGEINYIPNRVIIKFKPGIQSAEIAQLRQQMNAEFEFSLDLIDAEVWSYRDFSMNEVMATFSQQDAVDFIQPDIVYDLPDVEETTLEDIMRENGTLEEGVIPNDPQFNLLWAMQNDGGPPFNGTAGADVSAPQAWELETGSSAVIIAVLDSGVDYNHPDLNGNMWQDDDGNYGANFAGGNVNDPMDLAGNSHGTHVAGTIAAIGNNGIGVTGMMWNAQIMAVRVCGGGCPQSAIVQGLEYAIANGAQISNNSYGSQNPTSAGPPPAYVSMMEAAEEAGHFYIAAAGNANNNNDILNIYPANLMKDFDNVFSVGNSTPSDTRNPGSCFGAETVHLFAPGTNIRSTTRNSGYGYLSGTSMASPLVAGVAGLILSANPDADYQFIKERLMDGVDPLPAFENISISGGRVNAANSVLVDDGVPPATIDDLSIDFIGQNMAALGWTAVGNSDMSGRAGLYEIRYSTDPISEGNFTSAELIENAPRPETAGTEETYFIRGLDPETQYYFAIRAIDVFENEADISNVVTATTEAPPVMELSIDSISDVVNLDATETYSVTVTNSGTGPLRFVVPSSMEEEALLSSNPVNALDPRFSTTERTDGTVLGNPVPFGAGGPDNFGYFWFDDEQLQGLTFAWSDIAASGTELDFSNLSNGHAIVDLPFEFPFYGEHKESIGIAINGYASFGTIATTGSPNNVPLPNSSTIPRDLIAPFWTDLRLDEEGDNAVYTFHNEADDTFIIQWTDVNRNNSSESSHYTFQAILSKSGNITFQYLDMNGPIDHATVGVQASNTTDALQVAYNSDYTFSLKSVNISMGLPQWLSIDTNTGVIEPGATAELTVTINGADFVNGMYETDLVFLNNDLDNPILTLPVSIEATGGSPEVELSNSSIDFGLVYIDYPQTQEIEFTNTGRAALNIESIQSDNPFIEIEFNEAMNVPAEGSAVLMVTYNPESDDLLDTTLLLETDDTQNPGIEISLSGEGAGAPDLRVNRNSISAEVEENDMVSREMTFRNAGGSNLSYNISFNETTPGASANTKKEGLNGATQAIPGWILFVQSQGTIEPGEIREITLRFRGNVEPGEYTADMFIDTNEPSSAQRVVQLTMNVVSSTSAETDGDIPVEFALNQNYPNPFNPTTQIEYAVPEATHVTLEVFNIQGQRVATLINEQQNAGFHMATFDAERLSSGIYIYRITAGSFTDTQKMMLVK